MIQYLQSLPMESVLLIGIVIGSVVAGGFWFIVSRFHLSELRDREKELAGLRMRRDVWEEVADRKQQKIDELEDRLSRGGNK